MTSHMCVWGAEYERPISRKELREMGVTAPKMGWAITVAKSNDDLPLAILEVANVSGALFLRSATVRRPRWREFFGME